MWNDKGADRKAKDTEKGAKKGEKRNMLNWRQIS